jgi:predicted phage terminase large subunit-like protein
MGNPTSDDAAIINMQRLIQIEPKELPEMRLKFITADTAYSEKETADFSVFIVWGVCYNNNLYLLEIHRDQWGYPELQREARALINIHKPVCIGIEKKASGQSLLQTLAKELPEGRVEPLKADKSKTTRAAAVSIYIEEYYVHAVNTVELLTELIKEVRSLGTGYKDDIADTFVHGVQLWVDRFRSKSLSAEDHGAPRPDRTQKATSSIARIGPSAGTFTTPGRARGRWRGRY